MEGHNKHFSHTAHNLTIHQMSEGTEITCSGCNSSATATVYACWQCNFFLHEECYRANRSLEHPSHPSHPLTLLPFPTYPSNSFYCNSCHQVGTGFTYCCSECEFDLHVQCAYSISIPSHLTTQSIPNNSLKQETLHGFNAQHVYNIPNQIGTHQAIPNDTSIQYPLSNQAPIFDPRNAYIPSYKPQYASVPHQAPTHQPILSSVIPNYPPHPHIPKPEHNRPISIPNYPPISIISAPQDSQIPTPHNPQTIPSDHTQNYPPINENFNSTENSQIPSICKITLNCPPMNETLPSVNAPQNSQTPHAAHNELPTNLNLLIQIASLKEETSTAGISNTESHSKPDLLDRVKNQEIMHFRHPHALRIVKSKAGEESIQCSACEEIISDSRYSCSKSSCNFHLDNSCFLLAKEIQHKSHPEHPLTLLSCAFDEYGEFICSACYNDGSGFTYHCTSCEFNLHIKCASLSETVKHDDHEHPLKLVYSCPIKGQQGNFFCDVCGGLVQENWWTYYCEKCDYGTHVDCGNCEENVVKES